MKDFISKTVKIGASIYVLVPSKTAEELSLSEGQNVSVRIQQTYPFEHKTE